MFYARQVEYTTPADGTNMSRHLHGLPLNPPKSLLGVSATPYIGVETLTLSPTARLERGNPLRRASYGRSKTRHSSRKIQEFLGLVPLAIAGHVPYSIVRKV